MQEASLAKIPQQDVKHKLGSTPLLEEVKSAIKKLQCGKAPGIDGLPAEVYSTGGDVVAKQLTPLFMLFMLCWKKGIMPQDLRDAVIVSLYKSKVVKSDCSNYRGITLRQ